MGVRFVDGQNGMARMAPIISLVQKSPYRWIIFVFAFLLALMGLRRLLLSLYYVSGTSGYDFRYIWLAGHVWLNGEDPYSASFRRTSAMLTWDGHAPEVWLYPPNWWPLSALLAFIDLGTANLLWNIGNVLLCLVASFLIVSSFRRAHTGLKCDNTVRDLLFALGAALPLIHLFGAAELEATATVIAVGQTSLLIYFGLALLLYGIGKDSRPLCVAGLVILFLKPQIGLAFAALFLVYSQWTRRTLAVALGLSLVLALPALISHPLAPLEMVRGIIREGDSVRPNVAQAMTGLRNVLWHTFGLDVGGPVSSLFAALAAVAGALTIKRIYEHEDRRRVLWLCAILSAAATAAFAPLHFYDLPIIACLFPAVLVSSALFKVAALVGAVLVVRGDTLGKATGLYDPNVAIFEGSFISTIGAILLFFASVGAAVPAWFGRRTEPKQVTA